MLWETYFSFCLASFLMALMPGPDNIYVLTESLSKGARNGLWIAFGLNSGVLVHTLAAATGLSLILKQSTLVFQMVSFLGAAYLLYLAYQTAIEKVVHPNFGKSEKNKETALSLYKTGVLMNLLNPKVALFFIAFLPQFINQSNESIFSQAGLLGVTFLLIGFLTFAAIALLASRLRYLFKSTSFLRGMKWSKVVVLVVIAIFLILP